MKRREFRARQLSLALFTDAQARSRTQARSSQGLTSGGQLILKRASALLPSGEWNDDHYDVLADGIVVGRIFNARRAGRLALDVDVPLRSRARAETRARLCGDTRRRDGGVREQLAAGITRRVAPPLVIRSPQPVAHCHSELDALGWGNQPLSAAFNKFDIADPVALAPTQARFFILGIERRAHAAQQRSIDVLKCVHIHDGIEASVEAAGDHWHHAARGADMEVGGPGAESVLRQARAVFHSDLERSGGTGGPDAAVLGTERARAGACRDLGWLRFPVQREGDVAAVAAARDQHVCTGAIAP